jgi:hypothetical protein
MGVSRAADVLKAGLSAEQALALDTLGEAAKQNFLKLAELGDEETLAAVKELLRVTKTKGSVSNAAAAAALGHTASFMGKYEGRVSGDFVTKFARVATAEEKVVRAEEKLAELMAAGKNATVAERTVADAQAALARAKAETQAAVDILEGRTALGESRSVHALSERSDDSLQTPEFRVTGGGQPPRLVEVKALGERAGQPLTKTGLENNFGKGASQIGEQSLGVEGKMVGTGEKNGLVRLDASAIGKFPQTNEEIAEIIRRKWGAILKAQPGRADTIGWVEVLDQGPSGTQRLLLKVDGHNVTIETSGTTRVNP